MFIFMYTSYACKPILSEMDEQRSDALCSFGGWRPRPQAGRADRARL
jgi:hypothetical protein